MPSPAEAARLAPGDREPQGALAWLRSRSATTQAVVPGFYAWAVTIAPVFALSGVTALARVAAAIGFVSLVAGPIIERRSPQVARLALFWGLVASGIGTWALTADPLAAYFDAARGIAGMFGWTLFAFAIASPARPVALTAFPHSSPARSRRGQALDTVLLLSGLAVALVLEVPGWKTAGHDRALLVRLVAIAGGLGVVGASSAIAVARHRPVQERSRKRRRARVTVTLWVLAACLLMTAGTVVAVWGEP